MILEQFKLDGKVAVVTGGGRGIGQAYAVGLAEAGADVAIVDVIPMDETIAAIRKLGRKAISIKADLSKGQKESPKIIAKVVKALGSVDILVNNAGIIRREPFLEHSAKNWNDVISINLSTPFFLSQAAAAQMVKQGKGGKMVVVTSQRSKRGMAGYTGYCTSKGGADLMVSSMACDLTAKYGINVNSLCPTVFRSELTEWMFDPESEVYKNFLKREPIGRLAEPYDFVGFALFLSSEASAFMTGANYDCSGGYLTC